MLQPTVDQQTNISFSDRCKLKLVPTLNDAQTRVLQEAIYPLLPVHIKGQGRSRLCLVNSQGISPDCDYTSNPKLGRLIKVYPFGLNSTRIMTFHGFSTPLIFSPTLREVFACIRLFVSNWKVLRYFRLERHGDVANVLGNCHHVRCHLFGEEELDLVDPAWGSDHELWLSALKDTAKLQHVGGSYYVE